MPALSHRVRCSVLLCAMALLCPPEPAQARCANNADVAASRLGPGRGGSPATMTLSPVVWSVSGGAIDPVKGSDGLIHLSFSAVLTNMTDRSATVTAITAVDPRQDNENVGRDEVLSTAGANVTGKFVVFGGPQVPAGPRFTQDLPPGGSGVAFFDVTLPGDAALPRALALRVATAWVDSVGASRTVTVVGAPTAVGCEPAIVLSPPLKGTGWLDGNGCCRFAGAHRMALNPINGALRPSEQFAIDFVRLDADGRLFSGEVADLKSWPFYGVDVLAAAAGTVVEVVRDMPDEVPGRNPDGMTADRAAGNHVVIDMGQGRYALYAHLAPNSAAVRVGDTVRQGQRLGALGNSGNSDGPHLHFQVMDRPSPLDAAGLPFVFDRMRLRGRATVTLDEMEKLLEKGEKLPISTDGAAALDGAMPLTLDVLDFE